MKDALKELIEALPEDIRRRSASVLEKANMVNGADTDPPPSERGREPFLAAKRRGEIRRISADARKFQKEVSPDVLRERFREHDEFFLLLEKAEQLVGNLDNSAQIRKEFLDWINEGGMSRLSEMWEKLRIARPAIKAAGQHRRLLRALSVLGVIFTAIAAAGAWAN